MKVGIIANPHKDGVLSAVKELVALLEKEDIVAVVEDDTASDLGLDVPDTAVAPAKNLGQDCDVVVVLGGDGTMLDAAHRLGPTDVAVAGINLGHLGFLTSCKDNEMELLVAALKEESFMWCLGSY